MPSNYTISKELKRVADYREICGEDPADYLNAAWMVQSFSRGRLDELYPVEGRELLERTNEFSDEVIDTIVEIIEGKEARPAGRSFAIGRNSGDRWQNGQTRG